MAKAKALRFGWPLTIRELVRDSSAGAGLVRNPIRKALAARGLNPQHGNAPLLLAPRLGRWGLSLVTQYDSRPRPNCGQRTQMRLANLPTAYYRGKVRLAVRAGAGSVAVGSLAMTLCGAISTDCPVPTFTEGSGNRGLRGGIAAWLGWQRDTRAEANGQTREPPPKAQ